MHKMHDRIIGNGNNVGDNNSIQSSNDSFKTGYHKEWGIKSFEKTVDFSTHAIRYCLLLNGSACVALLAFLGTVWGKVDVQLIVWSLRFFSGGCILVICCSFFAYLAQQKFTHSAFEEENGCKKVSYKLNKTGDEYNKTAIVFGGLSVICFVIGVIIFSMSLQ